MANKFTQFVGVSNQTAQTFKRDEHYGSSKRAPSNISRVPSFTPLQGKTAVVNDLLNIGYDRSWINNAMNERLRTIEIDRASKESMTDMSSDVVPEEYTLPISLLKNVSDEKKSAIKKWQDKETADWKVKI